MSGDGTPIVDRRRFLAAVSGTAAVIAGCSGNNGSSPDSTPQDTPGGTPSTASPSSTDTPTASPTEGPPAPDGSRNTGPVTGIEQAYGIPKATPIGIDGDRVVARTLVDEKPALAAYNYLTGEQLWERNVAGYDTSAINARGQVGHGRLYNLASESDEDNYVNVIDVATGELLGTQEFDSTSATRLVPLDGGAFVMTGVSSDYTAFYVNGDTAEREAAFAPSDVWNLGQESPMSPGKLHRLTGRGMYVSGRRFDGEFRYGDTEPRQEITVIARTNSYGPPRASSETAIFGTRADGYSDDPPLQAKSRQDGSVLWERSDSYYVPPYGYGGETLTYLGADEGERVIGVEPSNGDIRWERTDLDLPTDSFNDVDTPFTVTSRALIVVTDGGVKLLGLSDGATVASTSDESFNPLVATQSRVLTTGIVATDADEVGGMVVYEY